ncbi:MAG: retroviral-like aspartic protease family protein [Sphingomonas sp.]|uniref:retropepsin-like aspartic protease n=1 Tax=Sphingomonas sp. TaxID=28214 RepID=UPI001B2A72E8|nr:retropepsin-like aspartic protease [Sphingomonas sp.]MBO9621583.1 retroviral-like aspartic protease family protein [Sphingomonas sp.]
MTRLDATSIALITTLLACAPAPTLAQTPSSAPTRAGISLESLLEAADRGETAPLVRALEVETDPDVRALFRARLAAARFDPAIAQDPALVRLAEGGDPALRRAALAVLTDVSFANSCYAQAARFGETLAAQLAAAGRREDAEGAERTWRLAALLARYPGQAVLGTKTPTTIAARTDQVGLQRIDIAVNGEIQEAVFDTGANLSVLSAATARRLGVAVLDATTPVSNSVAGSVPVRVGVARRVEIAGTVLTDVPFLVIDDAALTFPVRGGYDIRAIVGLPLMRALGRVRMETGAGRFTVLPPAGPAGPPNLHASGSDLFVDTTIAGEAMPLHLDTGANRTLLGALYAQAHPETVAALPAGSAASASAGGTLIARIATWAGAPLTVAGRRVPLAELPLTLPGGSEAERFYGALGSNALGTFASYTIDFAAMRLELGEPAADLPALTRD